MKKRIVPIAVCAFCFVAIPCLAGQIKLNEVDGYQVSLSWGQTKTKISKGYYGEVLSIRGNVKGGKTCEQLNVYVRMVNTGKNNRTSFTGVIHRYHPKGLVNDFYIKKRVSVDKDERNHWAVDEVFIQCLN